MGIGRGKAAPPRVEGGRAATGRGPGQWRRRVFTCRDPMRACQRTAGRPHSARRAAQGLSRTARREGSQQASTATAASTSGTAANVGGSSGLTP
jgi:hypothetical protein